MSTYRVQISCCNCYAVRHYDVDKGVPHNEATLICPNCQCCPTDRDYTVLAVGADYSKHKLKKENDNQ